MDTVPKIEWRELRKEMTRDLILMYAETSTLEEAKELWQEIEDDLNEQRSRSV